MIISNDLINARGDFPVSFSINAYYSFYFENLYLSKFLQNALPKQKIVGRANNLSSISYTANTTTVTKKNNPNKG